MQGAARGLCIVGLLSACGEEADAPQWSSCEEARSRASFFEVPPAELADPLEVGDELPVLRWTSAALGAEELATQAPALACILTGDEVKARPALLDWAQGEVEGAAASEERVFDRDVTVSLRRSGPRVTLSVGRDVSSEPALDETTRLARATAVVEALFEHGGIEGASIDDVQRIYFNTRIFGPDGFSETITTLASVIWRPRVGRAHVGLSSVEAWVHDNGHVSSITVPLARISDEGERVVAAVAESEAEALFVQKAEAGLTLEGWTIEGPEGQLSLPVREDGETAEVVWVGSYVAVSGDGRVGRRTPYFMSLSDPDAPLFRTD
ncbi:MAG: hypothetical protein ACRBN8_45670 [Nannocystales bacterium]